MRLAVLAASVAGLLWTVALPPAASGQSAFDTNANYLSDRGRELRSAARIREEQSRIKYLEYEKSRQRRDLERMQREDGSLLDAQLPVSGTGILADIKKGRQIDRLDKELRYSEAELLKLRRQNEREALRERETYFSRRTLLNRKLDRARTPEQRRQFETSLRELDQDWQERQPPEEAKSEYDAFE